MSPPTLVAALPARGARDWRGRGAWGRDAHLMRALLHHVGPSADLIMLLRTRVGGGERAGAMELGGIACGALPHPVEVPGWTRARVSQAFARRRAARVPAGVPRTDEGLVVCFDLLRFEAAEHLARDRDWPLVTDLMDDWRHHDSMPAWHDHLTERVYPRLTGFGNLLTSATRLAAAPLPALVVPNAGFHADQPPPPPRPGPTRPVAAFLGTVHPRIDADLLIGIGRALTDWDVVVAGPVMDRDLARRLRTAGIRMEPWWDMSEIDRRATVVIAPYARTDFTRSGDPLKVYEATARGVPCVSTIPVNAPPDTGLTVADPADFAEAVLTARGADRTAVHEAAGATGSWEDRAAMILQALDEMESVEGFLRA